MKLIYACLFFALVGQVFTGTAQTRVVKNINYATNDSSNHTLNIYASKEVVEKQDVIIFIHGGSWSSGKKETYWWLGRNFAKSKIVTVTINYPLAPGATFREMAIASAKAVKWVRDSISAYGGNPDRIFLMGHSAGAHLCELINADPQYFAALRIKSPVRGVILNDPFGLDMEEYLNQAEKDDYYNDFLRTFSENKKTWQLGSPLFYVKNIKNPHLIFYGTKTYGAIKSQSEKIYKTLQAQEVPVTLIVIKGKKHVGMISQMIWRKNQVYRYITEFLKQTRK